MQYAICTVSAAPLRKEPNHRAEMTSQLLFGESVSILEEKGGWVKIRCSYDGYEGWLTYHLITLVDENIATAPAPFVTIGLLNALHYNNEHFQIPIGCTLAGFSEGTHTLWDARYQYKGTCRNTAAASCTVALFQSTIQPWLNAPYLWGGKTVLGVDCSGFVQTVFKVLGVPLLRDAYQQAAQGTPVAIESVQEGDVAFFQNETGSITRVGLVLNDGKIMHASGKVRIDTLTREGIFTAGAGKQTHHLHSIKRVTDFRNGT